MVGALFLTATFALAAAEPPDSHARRLVLSDAIAFHVRSTDVRVQGWIRTGAADSQTFRDLLQLLADSDLIVHVQTVEHLHVAGHTYFVHAAPSVRYVRIEVVPARNNTEMIALIGHELQHAVEIAEQPRIRDRRGLALFYRSLSGNSGSTTEYDSVAARVVEDRVRREMAEATRAESHTAADPLLAGKNR